MAIYGIGASHSNKDVSQEFIKKSLACVGWPEKNAQPLHAILMHFKIGDIVYIKSHPPSVGLIIKAVGIVFSDKVKSDAKLGKGMPVKWLWDGNKEGNKYLRKYNDKYPVRNITLYEEFNREIQTEVLKLLLSSIGR